MAENNKNPGLFQKLTSERYKKTKNITTEKEKIHMRILIETFDKEHYLFILIYWKAI